MKKTRHTPEQIIRKLRQAEAKLSAGSTIPEIARELGISEATFHRWKTRYGGMNPQEAKRLKELEGTGKRERAPQEAACRKGTGHRHVEGGEPGKLLSPSRRRRAVKHLQQRFEVSEHRACRIVDQPRSSQRYVSMKAYKDVALAQRMVAFSTKNRATATGGYRHC